MSGDLSILNINQSITCVAAGSLKPDVKNDMLVVGTATNLLAYDVENNTDLFYKDVSAEFSLFILKTLIEVQ